MKIIIITICLIITTQSVGAELCQNIGKDLYLNAPEKHIYASDWVRTKCDEQSLVGFDKVKLPDAFFYDKGSVLTKTGDYAAARVKLQMYLQRTGKQGKHYTQVLELYDDIKDRMDDANHHRDGSSHDPVQYFSTLIHRDNFSPEPAKPLPAIQAASQTTATSCLHWCMQTMEDDRACEQYLRSQFERVTRNTNRVRFNEVANSDPEHLLFERIDEAGKAAQARLQRRTDCSSACTNT